MAAADFIVGNPPFIGNKRMRLALGDGYVEALRSAWRRAGDGGLRDVLVGARSELVRAGQVRRFGLITTNSITMVFNRQVIESHQRAAPPLHLAFAVPGPSLGSTARMALPCV